MILCFFRIIFLFFLFISSNTLFSQAEVKHGGGNSWIITSLGHINFSLTNTVKLPQGRSELFKELPFELSLGEVAVSFFNGRIGVGTCVYKREVPNHYLTKDKNPFFNGLGKNSWFPIIVRAPLLIKMNYNWFTGVSMKYELSSFETFRSDDFYKEYFFNTHSLACELNTQGTIIELGYCYHHQFQESTYFLPGKKYFYLKIGIGFLGNYFWNWKSKMNNTNQKSVK